MQTKNERIYILGCLMKQKNHKSYIKCVQFISLNLYSESNSVVFVLWKYAERVQSLLEKNVVNGLMCKK